MDQDPVARPARVVEEADVHGAADAGDVDLARRLTSSTISRIRPGMARHIGRSLPGSTHAIPGGLHAPCVGWQRAGRRGLLASEMPVPDRRDPVDRHLLRDTAYDKLREAIVDGTLVRARCCTTRSCAPGSASAARRCATRCAGWRTRASSRWPRSATRGSHADRARRPRGGPAAGGGARARHRARGAAAGADGDRDAARGRTTPSRRRCAAATGRPPTRPTRSCTRSSSTPVATRRSQRARPATRGCTAVECMCCQSPLPGGRSVAQHEALITRAETGDASGAASAARANWMTLGGVLVDALDGSSPL